MTSKKADKRKQKPKKQSVWEKEIMSLMSKSLKTALDAALDNIFKDWK